MLILLKQKTLCILVVLFQIQSVFFEIKDKKDDIIYYPQLFLDQCAYNRFINKVIFHSDLEFTDTEPESESESEEEINESIVLDE